MNFLKRLGKYYNIFEENLMVIFLAIMTAVVFVQVVLRHVFNNSLTWSEEGARFLFMWIIWMSMSVGFRDKSHIRMTVVSDLLSSKGKLYLNILNDVVIFSFAMFIAVLGWMYIGRLWVNGQSAPATKLPYALVYSCLPLSLSVCNIRLILEIIEDVKSLCNMKKGGGVE